MATTQTPKPGANQDTLIAHYARSPVPDLSRLAALNVTAVVTTQRSGSTMLGSQITQSGFGAAREHLQGLNQSFRQNGEMPRFEDWAARGLSADGAYFAIKIMAGHLPLLGAWWMPPARAAKVNLVKPAGRQVLARHAVDCLNRARNFVAVKLHRADALAQVYSRLRARGTGLYHMYTSGKTKGHAVQDPSAFDPALLTAQDVVGELASLLEDRATLDAFFADDADWVVPAVYETIVAEGAGPVLAEIAARFGLPAPDVPAPDLEKLTPSGEVAAFKHRFAAQIGLTL